MKKLILLVIFCLFISGCNLEEYYEVVNDEVIIDETRTMRIYTSSDNSVFISIKYSDDEDFNEKFMKFIDLIYDFEYNAEYIINYELSLGELEERNPSDEQNLEDDVE